MLSVVSRRFPRFLRPQFLSVTILFADYTYVRAVSRQWNTQRRVPFPDKITTSCRPNFRPAVLARGRWCTIFLSRGRFNSSSTRNSSLVPLRKSFKRLDNVYEPRGSVSRSIRRVSTQRASSRSQTSIRQCFPAVHRSLPRFVIERDFTRRIVVILGVSFVEASLDEKQVGFNK